MTRAGFSTADRSDTARLAGWLLATLLLCATVSLLVFFWMARP